MVHIVNGFVLAVIVTVGLSMVHPGRVPAPPAVRGTGPVLALDPTLDLHQQRLQLYDEITAQERQAHQQQVQEAAQAAQAAAAAAAAQAQQPFVPAPGPAPLGKAAVQDIIRQAFAHLGDGAVAWALRVAGCESGYNPNAVNPNGHYGLFQFAAATWAHSPYGSQSPFDPVANANAAAWLYQRDGPSQWQCQ